MQSAVFRRYAQAKHVIPFFVFRFIDEIIVFGIYCSFRQSYSFLRKNAGESAFLPEV